MLQTSFHKLKIKFNVHKMHNKMLGKRLFDGRWSNKNQHVKFTYHQILSM